MEHGISEIDHIRAEIALVELGLKRLKEQLTEAENGRTFNAPSVTKRIDRPPTYGTEPRRSQARSRPSSRDESLSLPSGSVEGDSLIENQVKASIALAQGGPRKDVASKSGRNGGIPKPSQSPKGSSSDEAKLQRSNGSASSSTGDSCNVAGRQLVELAFGPQNPIHQFSNSHTNRTCEQQWPLSSLSYKRYGRQMIVPQVGLEGQLSLKSSRVLVVGLGGLGCPAAIYLAAAGVGTLGLMDGDHVELSNLHRQILHTEESIGSNKAKHAAAQAEKINPEVKYIYYKKHMTPGAALEAIENEYDLVLDCTDQPSTRYMISDVAVIAGIPLVSASALKTEGQLLVLNNPPSRQRRTVDEKGFCYRCVFPKPPPASSVQACSEAGILGPIVGTMGCLMATEAIKILTIPEPSKLEDGKKTMLLYSAYNETPFRTIRLKGKRADCPSCSWPAKIDRHSLADGSTDYAAFCGRLKSDVDTMLPTLSAKDLGRALQSDDEPTSKPLIIDVRNKTEFGICHLPEARNIPLPEIQSAPEILEGPLSDALKLHHVSSHSADMVFICRYGNDSRVAAREAISYIQKRHKLPYVSIADVKGGLKAWKEEVDETFPEY